MLNPILGRALAVAVSFVPRPVATVLLDLALGRRVPCEYPDCPRDGRCPCR